MIAQAAFGVWLRAQRKAKRWSQTNLASEIPTHRNRLSRWEHGSGAAVRLDEFLRLCTLFGLEPATALRGILSAEQQKPLQRRAVSTLEALEAERDPAIPAKELEAARFA